MANGIGSLVSGIAATAVGVAHEYAYLTARSSFSGIIPDVVVREFYRDEMGITAHPVEDGSVVSDHAILQPFGLEMECGWSNASAGDPTHIDRIYEQLRAIQAVRRPFEIYTPRRAYRSMLLQGLNVTRDEKAGNCSLFCTLVFRQVIIASTQTTDNPNTAAPNPDQSQQKMPASTAGVTEGGTVQPVDVGPQAFRGTFSPGYAPGITDTPLISPGLDIAGISPPSIDALPPLQDLPVQDIPSVPSFMPGSISPYAPFVI